QTLADEPGYVQIHPSDAKKLGVKDQALVWISSRRGKVITRANYNDRVNAGVVYMTYQWWIGACNELTIEHLDPVSYTPEYKYCAVKIERIEDQPAAEVYVQTEYSALKAKLRSAAKG
ncbi:molybdopterin dinucleotide binding domain-containing protein, partial [Escherichia coli]|uniref:molybdopterin dinucleotide binding domain-containing protein n=2 Tax=Gammaproteobacteria TaxID=1236 RepID=UPI0019F76483